MYNLRSEKRRDAKELKAVVQDAKHPEKTVELPDCIAHPTGETCPVDWCRKARGQWCKRKGVWCRWRNF